MLAPAATLARRPAHLSEADAAALATAGVTALQALRDVGRLQAGQRVLIIGASGGVGSLAVGVAVRLGAEVTAVCGGAAADFVRALGATRIVERGRLDSLGDARFHVILDAACAYSWSALRRHLEPGGTYIPTLPDAALVWGMATAWLTGTRCAFVGVTPRRADLETLAGMVAAGMQVPIDATFPVREVGAAITRMARGGMRGRVVVTVMGGF